jgi:hypothetical protein
VAKYELQSAACFKTKRVKTTYNELEKLNFTEFEAILGSEKKVFLPQ